MSGGTIKIKSVKHTDKRPGCLGQFKTSFGIWMVVTGLRLLGVQNARSTIKVIENDEIVDQRVIGYHA